MNRILRGLRGYEKGQVLVLALVLLLLGGLIIAPLLGYMSTGLKAGQVHEKKMAELYAADAGIEDAIWKIKEDAPGLPKSLDDDDLSYSIANVNDKVVAVNIDYISDDGGGIYRVISTADGTTVDSIISRVHGDFSDFLDNVITSGGDIILQPNVEVYPGEGEPHGPIDNYPQENWPTAELLSAWYLRDVEDLSPYPNATIDIAVTPSIGPLYRDGDLDIINGGSAGLTAVLNGTVYVTGNLDIGKTNQEFTLDLNGETIFVEGEIDIGGKCTLTGSGCIIAVGDIFFSPYIDSNPDNYVFVMSVEGTVWFNPGSDFYGAIAGNVEVQLQPGVSATWTPPPTEEEGGVNFPGGGGGGGVDWGIYTWEIS